MAKERIDVLLTKKGLVPSREKAKIFIMAGAVYAADERVAKPDQKYPDDIAVEIKKNPVSYVSYGGVKLQKALEAFQINVKGQKALDIGSSTGGFVECLLGAGAATVHAVDAGTHQLHERLRGDSRVVLKENYNARYLQFTDVGETVDLITIDVSFISLKKILPSVIQFMKPAGRIISLVKPQFEVGRYEVGKGGIVKDGEKIQSVIDDIKSYGKSLGIVPVNVIEAPRERERKNREYFILWEHQKIRNP
ncbi:MAG TPA: TlyA family RNA methyltransferase [Syntrophorhabdaceae bacterium]|nr:TlyA family RNA methyltransferase [Syntrophorhabdaceae bacterium]HQM80018.1 TlyA family RNA methyltransferase [Syntrophorhabdaceae bacterium]